MPAPGTNPRLNSVTMATLSSLLLPKGGAALGMTCEVLLDIESRHPIGTPLRRIFWESLRACVERAGWNTRLGAGVILPTWMAERLVDAPGWVSFSSNVAQPSGANPDIFRTNVDVTAPIRARWHEMQADRSHPVDAQAREVYEAPRIKVEAS